MSSLLQICAGGNGVDPTLASLTHGLGLFAGVMLAGSCSIRADLAGRAGGEEAMAR